MRVLGRELGLRRAPVLGVAGTFEEVNPRHGWKSRHVLHGENERPFDQSMHHQPVLGRIDRRNPRMVALIMQAIRGDDSVQILERREAERRQARRRLGQALAIAAHDIGFELGRPPIGLAQRLLAGFKLPFRDRGRQVVALLRQGRAGNDCRGRRAGARSEQAPTGEAPFVSISWLGRGRGRLRRFGRPRAHLCTPCRSGPRLADDACNRRPDRLVRQERGAHSCPSAAPRSRAP